MVSLRTLIGACVAFAVNAAIIDPLAAYGFESSRELSRVDLVEGKLTKIVLTKGNGMKAKSGSTVTAHYDGRLAEEAKPFDSSRTR